MKDQRSYVLSMSVAKLGPKDYGKSVVYSLIENSREILNVELFDLNLMSTYVHNRHVKRHEIIQGVDDTELRERESSQGRCEIQCAPSFVCTGVSINIIVCTKRRLPVLSILYQQCDVKNVDVRLTWMHIWLG